MPNQANPSEKSQSLFRGEVEAQLKTMIDGLPYRVPIYLFIRQGSREAFDEAAVSIARGFQELSQKIEIREHSIDHELAQQWNVTSSPTFLFAPEHYSIRYLGVPYGEEGRTLLGIILLLGLRTGNLNEQSLKVLKKIDTPRALKIFVSPTCPYCPDQALHAVKAVIERPELFSVDIIDTQANPDLANRYAAYSVPQTFANDTLIAQGAQPEELFVLSVEKMEQQTIFIPDIEAEQIETDLVIVGGGPAGLAAGIYAVRSGLKTVVVERGPLGGQVATTPIVENYPGFTRVPGKTLVDIMATHALEYVQIFPGEEVLDITPGKPVTVKTSRRTILTRAVILATGANYKRLGVPGEAELGGRGVSYCATCDGSLFRGKRVIVVGGGNSAATEALYLHNVGVDVTMVHRRDALRAQEHLVKNIQMNQLPILWNTEVQEIRGKEKVSEVVLRNSRTGAVTSLPVDGVFIAIGYNPSVDLARKIGVELTEDGFIRHDSHHRTNIPGIYSAGDVEGGFKQIVTAMGQGTEAALSVYEDLMHPYWGEEKGKPEISNSQPHS